MILGLETTRWISERYPLVLMAHPAMAGSYVNGDRQGIDHGVLLGTLFRLAGADLSIFPNFGGRFAFSRDQCLAIRDRLVEPLGNLAPAWPAPGGGMELHSLSQMCADYGEDAVFLIGGALLGQGNGVAHGTREFLDQIRSSFDERIESPVEFIGNVVADSISARPYLAFQDGFQWQGRESTPYKDAADLAFKGVRRVELVGKSGERTHCDLRYFEVQPGGHTSHEKHLHTHIIIGARGKGVLKLGNRRVPLRQHDIAYIEPLKVHQLLNETGEPFGFYCIVEHDRDRPMKP
jgi:ribulose-bisphosphate carboxylase large chain